MTKLPKGWKDLKILELCDGKENIVGGPFGSNLKVEHYKNKGIPILRLQNIGKGYFIDKDIKYISKEKANELKYHSFQSGDLALAKLGIPIGKTCIIPENFEYGIVVADVVRIRPNKKKVDYIFLNYFLNSNISVSQLTKNISGSTRPRVNLDEVRNIIISIPPLQEQKRIVSILDKAFDNIEKAKKNIEQNLINSKELFQSKLDEIFSTKGKGWEEKKLEDVCEKIFAGGDVPKSDFSKFKTKNYTIPIYSNGVKDNGLYGYTNIKKVDQPSITISARGTIGFPIKRLDTFYPVIRLIVVIPNVTIINIDYLYFYLFKYDFIQSGTSIPQLTVPMVKPINIKLPPIKEQSNIVKILEELLTETQKLETTYIKQLENLEELKKSLLEKAFKGEL